MARYNHTNRALGRSEVGWFACGARANSRLALKLAISGAICAGREYRDSNGDLPLEANGFMLIGCIHDFEHRCGHGSTERDKLYGFHRARTPSD